LLEACESALAGRDKEIELLKEIQYRADSVIYQDSGHKELDDALRAYENWTTL